MATFTITTTENWDSKTGKTGGDTITVNGGNLTIDGHSRFDLNGGNTSATAATTLGTITISATLGGTVTFDGTKVRLIAYTDGVGTLPTMGSTVTMGGASGKIMCVYSSMTAAPVTSGTIPASGWIQIKQWNSVEYSAGALTLSGITATSSGASKVGFLEIMGDNSSSIVANRLGSYTVTGEWYSLGTTSGVSNQTIQIPNHGTKRYISGVFIEKTAGLKDYEFYPNAGTATTIGTEAARGKVVWIDDVGLIRIGNNGSATSGYTPVAGLEVVIGNVFFCNNETTVRNAVVIPNATLGTRYDYTTTGGGVINVDKCESSWYFSVSQAYSCNVSNSGFVDAIYISEIATPMTWSKVGVGNKPTTALLVPPLQMLYCYVGGAFTDCVFSRESLAASGAYTAVIQDIVGFTFNRCTIRANTIQAHATVYSILGTRVKDTVFNNHTTIQGANIFATCDGVEMYNTTYINCVSGTTVTTYATYVWYVSANTINCTFSGLSLPLTNCQPYTAILIGNAGCAGIKLRNIGTRVAPLSLGTVNNTAHIYTIGNNCSDFKIQRVYVATTRTGIMAGDNSCHEITEENVFGDYADAVDVMACINMKRKGMGGTGALTAQTSVYGTHWRDGFTSTTAGRIAILMNEPTALTTNQVVLSNGAKFTSAGGLYMPVIGHSATFEMPEYIIGHTAFANTALVMAGGIATNYNYNYAIDKNDGGGWSTMTTANYTATTLGTALSGITGINAQLGFKLRLKITTGTTNTTAITSVYITTVSTATAQDYQYPLDIITLSLTGLVSGSDIVILNAGTEVERVNVDANLTTFYNYVYETPGVVDIKVYKRGYVPFSILNFTLSSSDASVPVAQVVDRNYIE